MRQKGYVYHDKRENCWYARVTVTDNNGKRRNVKKRAESEAEARKRLKVLTQQIEDEGSKAVDFAKVTFNELADYYERHFLKPAEYVEGRKLAGLRDVERPRGFLPNFRAFFGRKKLREITYGDIHAYRSLRLQTPTRSKRPRSRQTRVLNVTRGRGGIPEDTLAPHGCLFASSGECVGPEGLCLAL